MAQNDFLEDEEYKEPPSIFDLLEQVETVRGFEEILENAEI